MDGILFYVVLAGLALFAFILNQSNNSKLALLVILFGAYLVYSKSTGHTATEYKNQMVDSLNDSAEDYAKTYKVEGFDETKRQEQVK